MENLLEFDLNEVVSKQITEKIEGLQSDLKEANAKISGHLSEISRMKKEVDESKKLTWLLEFLRSQYSKIEASEKDSSGYYDSKQKKQFDFIEGIMANVFGINREFAGWYSSRDWGSLAPHLAVNFYSHRELVVSILKLISDNSAKEISFIIEFKMPYDYSKEEVLNYVKSPKYNTNGCVFGVSKYWIEAGAGKTNMPHDLIMRSPFIVEDDVFDAAINTIKKKSNEYSYLFAIPEHNPSVSEDQIKKLGSCLIDLPKGHFEYDPVKTFVKKNMGRLNTETLEFLFKMVSSDNQFKIFDWQNFPNDYQMRFLKSKNIDEVLKIITNYSCTWTIEQKDAFLKSYYK